MNEREAAAAAYVGSELGIDRSAVRDAFFVGSIYNFEMYRVEYIDRNRKDRVAWVAGDPPWIMLPANDGTAAMPPNIGTVFESAQDAATFLVGLMVTLDDDEKVRLTSSA